MTNRLPQPKNIVTLEENTSAAQIKEVTDFDGAVIVPNLICTDLLARFNSEVDRFFVEQRRNEIMSIDPEADKFTRRLAGLAARTHCFADIILTDRILDWAEACLDGANYDIQLGSAQVLEVWPGAPTQVIHQDGGYAPFHLRGADKPEVIASCIIALTDFTADNGATRVIPGTHKLDIDWNEVSHRPETVPAVMRAGSGMFFTGKVAHGAGANMSNAPRRGMTLCFYAGYLKPEEAHTLVISRERARQLPPRLRQLLGFTSYYGRGRSKDEKMPMAWQYEIGDASQYLERGPIA
ncbi:ectoine hydroxylase-related dioxygenase (phytanoyl-CoA dioxygenase family) [Paraburkholderia sp. BL27I4N3]|nr:ectoine hydroxylase-related dioxygenase (phytanoyl-CoA dioxygenase family) [Paraburkholderia sp. BL27I4N3]